MAENIRMLLIEDNQGDVILLREALNEAGFSQVFVLSDGESALQYLRKEGRYVDEDTPELILLDINLPRINGFEVLHEIKNDLNLKVIPVMMLSSSESPEDIMKAYEYHANCYLTKPLDYTKFIEDLQQMKKFWTSVVKLPTAL